MSLIVGIVYTPGVVRVVRAKTITIAALDFVRAAELRGERLSFVLMREIAPNLLGLLAVEFAIRCSSAILKISALSFLGLGISQPTPDWGLMVQEAMSVVFTDPWFLILPAITLSSLIIGINFAVDGLARAYGVTGTETRAMSAHLKIKGLTITYRDDAGNEVAAVRDATIALARGETLGIVGESGSGKSTLARALLAHTRPGARFASRDRLPRRHRCSSAQGRSPTPVPRRPGSNGSPKPALLADAAHDNRRATGRTRPAAHASDRQDDARSCSFPDGTDRLA